MVWDWLARWGITRESAILLWAKIVSAALLVTTGLFDPHVGGFDPALLGFSPEVVHKIQAAAALVLFIAAQGSKSQLPGKADAEKVSETKRADLGTGV